MAEPLGVVGAVASIAQLLGLAADILHNLNDFRSTIDGIPDICTHTKKQMELTLRRLAKEKEMIYEGRFNHEDEATLASVVDGFESQIKLLLKTMNRATPKAGASGPIRLLKAFKMSIWYDVKLKRIKNTIHEYRQALELYQSRCETKPSLAGKNYNIQVIIPKD